MFLFSNCSVVVRFCALQVDVLFVELFQFYERTYYASRGPDAGVAR